MKPRLLDLFCGAGGAGSGYTAAGFEVTGVDIAPQPRYPFAFAQANALEYLSAHGSDFDVIHASPPCQAYSTVSGRSRHGTRGKYPDLVGPTRDLLTASGKVWVLENVPGSPMRNAIMLCGSSFGLDVRRHRHFECSILILSPPCEHGKQRPRFSNPDSRLKGLSRVVGVYGHHNYAGEIELRQRAMGIDWMNIKELTQAIPPAYTRFIGSRLLAHLEQSE